MLSLYLIILGHMAYGVTNGLWKGPRDRVGTLPLILMRSFGCCVIFFISHLLFTYFQVLPTVYVFPIRCLSSLKVILKLFQSSVAM